MPSRHDATPLRINYLLAAVAHSSLARALSAGMKIASASSYRTSRLPAIWCRMRPFAPSFAALLRSARSTARRAGVPAPIARRGDLRDLDVGFAYLAWCIEQRHGGRAHTG